MKKRMIALITGCILIGGISIGSLAAGTIQIFVDGRKIESDVSPRIMQGRTMVPIRTAAEALGAEVRWDSNNQKVLIDTGTNIWDEPFDPWQDLSAYQAVYVVNEYLALLQGAVWGGDLYGYPFLFSKRVREAVEPWSKVWQPAMSGRVGSSVARLNFRVLDGHVAGKDESGNTIYEVAARVQYYDRVDEPAFTDWIKAYTVIVEEDIDENGGKFRHLVIDGERMLKEVKMHSKDMPDFWNSFN